MKSLFTSKGINYFTIRPDHKFYLFQTTPQNSLFFDRIIFDNQIIRSGNNLNHLLISFEIEKEGDFFVFDVVDNKLIAEKNSLTLNRWKKIS
jgi:hypothetical protein